MIVRDATEADLPAMAAIYDHLIATTDVIWYEEQLGAETFAGKVDERFGGQWPWIVATEGDEVVGYATFGPFRSLPGYAHTVEHSIFAAAGHERRGIGQILLDELIDRARSLGKSVMVAAIDGGNDGSIRFHARNGFREVARMPGVGAKFGLALDLVLMQRDLDRPSPPAAARAGSVQALDHVQLAMPAGREPEAVAFYEGLLGIAQVAKPPHLAARGGCWFEDGQVKVHLGVDPAFRPARKAHPALRVSRLAVLVDTLRDAGVAIVDDEPLAGHDRVYVDDPFGNRIELLEPATTDVR